MPEGMMPNQGGAPPGAPPAGGPPGGQATGPTPATTPVANQGLQAAALAKLAVLVQALTTLLPTIPAGSDGAKDLREAINKLAKHVPPGAVSQGILNMSAQQMALQQRQMAPQIAAQRASQMNPPAQPAAPPQMAAA